MRMLRMGIVDRNFEHGVSLSSGSNMSEAYSRCALSQRYDGYLPNVDAVNTACHT